MGSSFGLKPYSSTSFLRASSAFFLALRFRQNQIPASRRSATTTTGTTTAMAVFPPALSSPVACLDPGFAKAGSDGSVDELVGAAPEEVAAGVLDLTMVCMTVMGVGVSLAFVGVGVTTDVTSSVEVGVVVSAVTVDVAGGVVDWAAEVAGALDEEGCGAVEAGCDAEDGGASVEAGGALDAGSVLGSDTGADGGSLVGAGEEGSVRTDEGSGCDCDCDEGAGAGEDGAGVALAVGAVEGSVGTGLLCDWERGDCRGDCREEKSADGEGEGEGGGEGEGEAEVEGETRKDDVPAVPLVAMMVLKKAATRTAMLVA